MNRGKHTCFLLVAGAFEFFDPVIRVVRARRGGAARLVLKCQERLVAKWENEERRECVRYAAD